MHAETMLFVDDGKAEIVEGDTFLKQGMGADDDIDDAGCQSAREFASRAGLCRGR